MKLKLNKKKMKSLSKDNKAIPAAMTPQVAGGAVGVSAGMTCFKDYCDVTSFAVACKEA